MKKNLLSLSALISGTLALFMSSCLKPGIKDPVTLDKAAGKWSINAIRMQIYNGLPEPMDSIVPWRPDPENYVSFDGISSLQYSFNTPAVSGGEYKFIGNDSIQFTLNHETTRWKILLLTGTNFNISRTSSDNNAFPGATVVTYQSFVR